MARSPHDPVDDTPTFKDFYSELGQVRTRVSRVEKIVVALVVVTASPKLGGPSAPDLVTALLGLPS